MAWNVRRLPAAVLLVAGLVSLSGCEYLLILALHRTVWVEVRYEGVMGLGRTRLVDRERWCERLQEDAADPDAVFVRIRIMNEVEISSGGTVWLHCRREGGQQEFSSLLLRRHPAHKDIYCEALASGHRHGRGSREKAFVHGSYIAKVWIGMLWDRDRGGKREVFLQRPFGLRCHIRGGEMYTLTLRSKEIVIPAADLVRAVSASREPVGGSR